MANVKNISVSLQVFSAGFGTKLKQATGEVTSFGSKVKSSISSATKDVAAGAAKMAAAFGIVKMAGKAWEGLTLGVQLAASTEQAQIAFAGLLGSADKAQQKIKEIKEFAAKTPFEQNDIRSAAQALLTFGVSSDEVMSKLKTLGDISAGTGSDLAGIAQIYGKATAKQKVELETLNQLAERGVPIFQKLAEQQGVSVGELAKMVSAGKVGIADLDKAFENLTSNGGMFSGAMEKQSTTLTGVWSTMKDSASLALESISATLLGAFDVKSLVVNLGGLIDNAVENFMDWKDVIVQWAHTGKASLLAVFDIVKTVASGIYSTLVKPMLQWFGVDMTSTATDWKESITDALITVQYYAENWRDSLDLAFSQSKLFLVSFANDVVHFFLNVIPKTFTTWGSATLDFFRNAVSKIGELFGELWDYILSGGDDKIEIDFSGLTEGFSQAMRETRAAMQREKGAIEQGLIDEVALKQQAFSEGLEKFKAEKKKADEKTADKIEQAVEKSGSSPVLQKLAENKKEEKGKKSDAPSILNRGSVEAFQAIFNARQKQVSPELQAMKKQLDEQKKQTKELEKLNKNKEEVITI